MGVSGARARVRRRLNMFRVRRERDRAKRSQVVRTEQAWRLTQPDRRGRRTVLGESYGQEDYRLHQAANPGW